MTTLANSTLSFLIIWMSCGAAFVLATHKLCGSALVDALAVVCNGRGYYGGTVWRTKREGKAYGWYFANATISLSYEVSAAKPKLELVCRGHRGYHAERTTTFRPAE
ncbi:hypothetical protein HOLleu_09411 [Holothuria leucospilota]|uniref:Insulin-like domain-containing protein n=1 Tax=Holothuria leucospilota TaxID=206669 RepID=A0A9Q1HE43_HOLLE|nr:hypothetical protein HOLleu_09411 [Holothuria leucospilota]